MKIKKIAQTPGLVATVVDNLTSSSTIDALSANQGKILNDKVNTGFSYSTNETLTRKTWTNGKPIYRRVVVIPNVTATQTTYNLSSIPIEICMVNTSNSFFAQGNYILPIVFYGSNTDWSRAFFEVSTKKLYVQFGSVYTMSKNIYVTIEYTKTTD